MTSVNRGDRQHLSHDNPNARPRAPVALVVDDEPHIGQVVALSLSRAGMRPVCCGNGAEALERARMLPPEIVITDQQMPRMTGIEFVQRLRDLGQHPPVLMLTARGCGLARTELEHAGIVGVMTKPFSPRALVARATALLGTASAAEAA